MIPETVGYTYRALRIVQGFGQGGCTIAQYGNKAWASAGAGHNRIAARVLMSLERRGLVSAIGEDPREAASSWDRYARSRRRSYVISEAGEAFIADQVRASTARARELAAAAGMARASAQEPSEEGIPAPVGSWDP